MSTFEAKLTDNPPEYTDLMATLPYFQEGSYNALQQMEGPGFDMVCLHACYNNAC